ncbi:MAG: DUF1707 domain-containing protein [Myxococcota bacterium]
MADDPSDAFPRVPRPLRSAIRAEREAVIARLQDAVAADHLELDELEERLDLAMQARTSADLKVLVQDLPEHAPSQVTMRVAQRREMVVVPQPAPARAPMPAVAPAQAVATYLEPEPIRVTCIFSGHQLEGRRVMPREVYIRAVFGGAELDLREATFLPGVTTVVCKATFGGVHIVVPPHVRVECIGTGIFGAFHGDNSVPPEYGDAPDTDDMPVLRVVGRALFGGVHAERRGAKRKRLPKHHR